MFLAPFIHVLNFQRVGVLERNGRFFNALAGWWTVLFLGGCVSAVIASASVFEMVFEYLQFSLFGMFFFSCLR